jgi:fumarylacetoacetase
MKSWINVPTGSDFTIYNLPFGVCSFVTCVSTNDCVPGETKKTCVTIIGETVIDLGILQEAGVFDEVQGLGSNVFDQPTLNEFLKHPKDVWLAVRSCLIRLLQENPSNDFLISNRVIQQAAFHDVYRVKMQLPMKIGDYTDFYASREHATNVGTMFRGAANALNDNWLQLPVGYHGRSSTVICSGTPVRRPCGQIQKDPTVPVSIHAPCEKLDFELEIAAVIGGESNIYPMTIKEAKDRIFGYVLMNDWSARDIQKWEYIPLGPFTSKNFATSISPWIVMTAALEGYIGIGNDDEDHYSFTAATSSIEQTNPIPLPYLQDPNYSSYDVKLFVSIFESATPSKNNDKTAPRIICTSNFRNMYWNAAQQLVHHSVSGCVMNAGDVIGSGTISGSTTDSYGSLLELSSNGSKDVQIGDGKVRRFLMDGDTVLIRGYCENETAGIRIGFGECAGSVLPPHDVMRAGQPQKVNSHCRFHDFVLFQCCRQSYVWPVHTALVSKQLVFRIMDNDTGTERLLKKNVENLELDHAPRLQWTDRTTGITHNLSKALSIISLLDDCFPDRRSLIPADPMAKAISLEIIELIGSGIQPQFDIFFKEKVDASRNKCDPMLDGARACISTQFEVVESLLRQYHDYNATAIGPFALGTFSPTVVDLFLIPQLYDARLINLTLVNLPRFAEIESVCMEHTWFIASKPDSHLMSPSAQKKYK